MWPFTVRVILAISPHLWSSLSSNWRSAKVNSRGLPPNFPRCLMDSSPDCKLFRYETLPPLRLRVETVLLVTRPVPLQVGQMSKVSLSALRLAALFCASVKVVPRCELLDGPSEY